MRSRYLVISPILPGRFGSNLLFGTSRYLQYYPADLAQTCCLGPLAMFRILSLRLIHAMHAPTSMLINADSKIWCNFPIYFLFSFELISLTCPVKAPTSVVVKTIKLIEYVFYIQMSH